MARPAPEESDEAAERPDGRSVRAERTRDAIVDGLLGLLGEGVVAPTIEQIAGRAGVSQRSIFLHFHDREAVLVAAGARRAEQVGALVEPLPSGGPLERRLEAFLDQRVRVLEEISPYRRAAVLVEPSSEAVAAGLAMARRAGRAQLEQVFGPELEGLPATDRAEILAALDATCAWPFWESLRRHQGLDLAAARAALRRALIALLG